MIASPRQFVSDRFEGHDPMLACLFAFVPPTDGRVITRGVVGRLHKRPAQIAVAALAIAMAFPFAVAKPGSESEVSPRFYTGTPS